MSFQVVIFSVGSEEYCLPIEVVQEITHLDVIHPIPQSPEYVKGLIRIRGQAIPLIDMQKRFGVQALKDSEYAITTESNGNLIGFAVDDVKEVLTIDELSPPPPLITIPFIAGIVNLPDRMIIQIHPDLVLKEEEIDDLKGLIGSLGGK